MEIEITIFDPHHWMFELGISLKRFEETHADSGVAYVRKTFSIGLLLLSINFHTRRVNK